MCFQHVLRNNVIPKARDQVHIIPLLSIVTYFAMASTHFNVVNVLIDYITNFIIVRDLDYHRKPNLALGHFFAYNRSNMIFPTIPILTIFLPTSIITPSICSMTKGGRVLRGPNNMKERRKYFCRGSF